MNYIETEYNPDSWTLGYEGKESGKETPEQFKLRVKTRWEKTVRKEVAALDFMVGLKPSSVDWGRVVDEMVSRKGRAVWWNLVLTRSELRLDTGLPAGTQFKLGSVKVPSGLEDYRTFLENLSNWPDGSIVSTSDFKSWSAKNPKKPTEYKHYLEMLQKSKSDTAAFIVWAKSSSAATKALGEVEKTKKMKPADAARVAALKAVDASMQTYYKSF